MTQSDRAVMFIVAAALAALTIQSVGIAEKNSAFQDKMFELRARELGNVIDAMDLYRNGHMTKRLPDNWTINFETSETPTVMEVDREGIDPVEVPIDANPDTSTVQGETVCIRKETDFDAYSWFSYSTISLTVSEGECS